MFCCDLVREFGQRQKGWSLRLLEVASWLQFFSLCVYDDEAAWFCALWFSFSYSSLIVVFSLLSLDLSASSFVPASWLVFGQQEGKVLARNSQRNRHCSPHAVQWLLWWCFGTLSGRYGGSSNFFTVWIVFFFSFFFCFMLFLSVFWHFSFAKAPASCRGSFFPSRFNLIRA